MAIKDVILGYAKGEKGDPGPRGEKGNTGATGPKGDPGNIADAQITDTEGLDVAKGQKTTAQKLFDAIANRIVTKLVTNDALTKKLADYMLKGMMSNTNVNNTGTVPTSALMYSMFEQINNNMDPSTMIIGNIIDYAESLPNGFRAISVDTRTSQTPNTLNYGTGYIEKSGTTDIVIVLHNFVLNETNVKRKSNIGWTNWETYALKSDLDSFAEKKLSLTISNFNSYVKSKTNRISFFVFGNAVDSPFSFQSGFCIAFNHEYLIRTDQFCLIGMSDDGTKIETKRIQIS